MAWHRSLLPTPLKDDPKMGGLLWSHNSASVRYVRTSYIVAGVACGVWHVLEASTGACTLPRATATAAAATAAAERI